MNNADRVELGLAATAPVCDAFDEQGQFENLTDTLANLLHYANANDLDFEMALADARMHYEAEVEEEDETETALCDWCEREIDPIAGEPYMNGFVEMLCTSCAAKCCSTCSRGLANNPEEHDGCTMIPLHEQGQEMSRILDNLKTIGIGLVMMVAMVLYTNSSCDPYSPGRQQQYDNVPAPGTTPQIEEHWR